jgi:hypothetical protein
MIDVYVGLACFMFTYAGKPMLRSFTWHATFDMKSMVGNVNINVNKKFWEELMAYFP